MKKHIIRKVIFWIMLGMTALCVCIMNDAGWTAKETLGMKLIVVAMFLPTVFSVGVFANIFGLGDKLKLFSNGKRCILTVFSTMFVTVSAIIVVAAIFSEEFSENSDSYVENNIKEEIDSDLETTVVEEDSEIKKETEEKEEVKEEVTKEEKEEYIGKGKKYNPETGEWETIEKPIKFGEDWIEGAPRDVKGREEYVDKLLEIASLNDCSEVFVEYESDGSLYVMIYCQREIPLAKRITEQIVDIKSDYKKYVFIDFIDQSKGDDEADIVFYRVDIEEDGTYNVYED